MTRSSGSIRTIHALLAILGTLAGTLALARDAAAADVPVFGNVTVDTTWTTGNTYLLKNDVAVNAGVTLTIQPGVTVKPATDANGSGGLDGAKVEFTIHGKLLADASAGAAIVFTSAKATPAPGDWYGVVFKSTVTTASILKNAEVHYAVQAIRLENVPTANLTLDGLKVTKFSSYGAYLTGASATIGLANAEFSCAGAGGSPTAVYHETTGNVTHTGLNVYGCGVGLYANDSNVTVNNSLFHSNTSRGLQTVRNSSTSRSLTVNNSTLYANGAYAIEADNYYSNSGHTITVKDTLVTGYGTSAFYGYAYSTSYNVSLSYTYSDVWKAAASQSIYSGYISVSSTTGSFSENPLLANPAALDFHPTERSPLRFSDSSATTPKGTIGLYDYDGTATPGYQGVWWSGGTLPGGTTAIEGDVTVPKGQTLTIPAGATLTFATSDAMFGGVNTSRCELIVKGTLVARGTPTTQITLTSAASGKDDWYGLHVTSGAESLDLAAIDIRNATRCLWLDATNLVPADLSAANCNTAVYVNGGNPQLTKLYLRDSNTGLEFVATQADVNDLVMFNMANYGANIGDGSASTTNAFTRCKVYDNKYPFYVHRDSSSAMSVSVDHCTIAYNSTDAFQLHNYYSNSGLSLSVTASAITHNTGYAFYGYAYSTSYNNSVTWTRSDVWKNTGVSSGYVNVSKGTGSLEYNPLWADGPARKLVPTKRSPLRYSDGSDKEIGYEAYNNDPTPGYQGFYWENFQFNAGTYDIEGDIVITNRKLPGSGVDPTDPADDVPPKITFVPGVTLKMAAKADDMGGGKTASRIEIVNRGILEMDGISFLPVRLLSNAATPAAGDWYGVIVPSDAFATNVSEVDLKHGDHCVRFEGNSHIAKNIEASICNTGVHVEGGSPEVRNVNLHDNDIGLNLVNTNAKMYDVVAYRNTSFGVRVETSAGSSQSLPFDGCLVYANKSYGFGLVRSSSASQSVTLNRCTIDGNKSYGVYTENTYSNSGLSVSLTNSSVTSNTGYAVYGYAYSTSYNASVSVSNTDVWGHSTGNYGGYVNWNAGSTLFSYNPLYKDPVNADYTPTDRSPLRCAHADKVQAAGYKPYVGDPTGKLVGYLHGDMTLTAAGSPYVIPGDLIVDNKCSTTATTLTIEAGAVLKFEPKADLMGGGQNVARAEVRVVDKLVVSGTTTQAQLTSNAATPAKGDWGGIVLDSGSVLDATGFIQEYGEIGFRGSTTAGNKIAKAIVRTNSSNGVSFQSGADVQITDSQILSNGGPGIQVEDLTGTVQVLRSIVLDNASYAAYARNTTIRLINNVLMGSDHGFYGIRDTNKSMQFDLWNNTIHEHKSDCIHTYNSYGSGGMTLYAKNNLLTWCVGYAVRDDGYYDVTIPGSGASAGWNYNNFFQTYNYTSGNSHYGVNKGANDTSFDPRYEDIDPSGKRRWYDLRLLLDSPVKDAGLASGGYVPNNDLILTARPKEGGVDVGAYEYDPAVNHDPWAAAGPDQLVAVDEPTCFDASGTTDYDNDAMTYLWTFGDGQSATGKVVCHPFANNVVHEVILTVTDARGGVDHDVLAVDVNKRPIAEAGPEVYCAAGGDAAAFDGRQSKDLDGTVVGYLWDFGDGGSSTSPNPSHQYAAGPTKDFLVTLTVTDNDGFTSSDTTIAHVIGTSDTEGPLIVHTPIGNGRPEGIAVDVAATISDYSNVSSATVYYRKTGTASWSTATMTNLGGTSYKGTIPSSFVTSVGVDYYIEAKDAYTPKNTSTHPVGAPTSFHKFTVNPQDLVGPTIVHTPIANGQQEGVAVPVTATVTDASGVASVKLYYKITTGSTWANVAMTPQGDNVFKADIPAVVVTSAGVDYYIEATDGAPAGNKSTAPTTAPGTPYRFTVNVSDTTGPTITHTPIPNGQPERVAVTVSATITDTSGIQVANLFYRTIATPASPFASVPMTKGTGDTYSATIPSGTVTTAGVQYYIYAQDNSAGHNGSLSPTTAPTTPYSFTVTSADTSGPSIAHTPIADGQTAGQAVAVSAGVVDSSGVASVTLYYRLAGDPNWTLQPMVKGVGDNWTGTIPAATVALPAVQYYLKAIDSSPNANETVLPASAPGTAYQFTVKVNDTTGPDVTHTPIANGQIAGSPVAITATVVDASGVNSVTLYWRASGGSFAAVPMTLGAANTYSANIPGGSVAPPSMQYYVVAIDNAAAHNTTTLPASAPGTPFSFTVAAVDLAGPSITHTPIADGQTQGVAVPVSATVTDATGVASVTLYYRTVGGSFANAAMTAGTANSWTGTIPAGVVLAAGVEYYLKAVDTAPGANQTLAPATAPATPYKFTVRAPDTAGPVVSHTQVANGRPAGQAVAVSADVTDASGVAGVALYFKPSGDSQYSVVQLVQGTGNTWSGSIPAFAVVVPSVSYYLVATDKASTPNTTTVPSGAPATPYTFTVVQSDTTGPSISHTPIADGQVAGRAVDVTANVTDATGVGTVTLKYRTGSGAYSSTAMTSTGGSGYKGTIPAGTVAAPAVDYYIEATDTAASPNTSVSPSGAPAAPYRFTVIVPDTTAPTVAHTPVADGRIVGSDVPVSATVTDASGVASVTLYYRPGTTGQFASVPMVDDDKDNVWQAIIPSFVVTAAGVDYFITAIDKAPAANQVTVPATAPTTPYHFTAVVLDTTAPTISHGPVADGQQAGKAVTIQAYATDASGVAGVTLYFRQTGTTTWASTALADQGSNLWTGSIPGYAVTTAGVQYYLEATDKASPPNKGTSPAGGASSPYAFTVTAGDTSGPSIAHVRVADGQIAGTAVDVTATVVDTSGVGSATLRYRKTGTTDWTAATMTTSGGGVYKATIPAGAIVVPGVDYYLEAKDSSAAQNASVDPAGAPAVPYRFTVVVPDTTAPSIAHTPVANGRTAGQDVPVSALVTDVSGVASVALFFRVGASGAFSSVAMADDDSDGNWTGTIPGYAVTTAGVNYYLQATDKAPAANKAVAPSTAPGTPYSFTVVVLDKDPPAITHSPVSDGQPAGKAVTVQAFVTDASGVASAALYFRPTGSGAFTSAAMTDGGGGLWTGSIPSYAVTTAGVDYYLVATDKASPANTAKAPATAPGTPYTFAVTAGDTTGPSIAHARVADGQVAGKDVAIAATISDPSGVATARLHYRKTGTDAWTTVTMTGTGSSYEAIIPGTAVATPGIDYYIDATDGAAAANVSVDPAGAPGVPYRFTVVVPDTTAPTLVHTAVANGRPVGADVAIEAVALDVSGVASVTLRYRAGVVGAFSAVDMADPEADGTWTGTIPGYAVTTAGVDYYLTAIDQAPAANTAYAPATAPGVPYHFTAVVVDTDPPQVAHSPIPDGQKAGQDVAVQAFVTDASGVATVALFFRPTGAEWVQASLADKGGGLFTGKIPGYAVTTAGVEYYLLATDKASPSNSTYSPAGAPAEPYAFGVTQADTAGPSIAHVPIEDGRSNGVAVTVTALVDDPSGVNAVSLFARKTGSANFLLIPMTKGSGTTWTGTIPAETVAPPSVEYYLQARDSATPPNLSFDPAEAQDGPHVFTVLAKDTEGPAISHEPVADGQSPGATVTIEAKVTDASGVASVKVHFRPKGTTVYSVASLTPKGMDVWGGTLPTYAVIPPGVEYWLEAADAAVPANTSTDPDGGANAPYAFTVAAEDTTGPAITHTPVADGQEPGAPVFIQATVTDPSGVATVRVHFRPQGTATFSVASLAAGADNQWTGTIPAYAVVKPGVQYYLEATDAAAGANKSADPAGAPATTHAFAVGSGDLTGPAIDHVPLSDGQQAGQPVSVHATVTDASGVAEVVLHYRASLAPVFTDVPMTASGDTWSAEIPGAAVVLPFMDYYISAKDSADPANESTHPNEGASAPHSFAVTEDDQAGPALSVTPVPDGQAPGQDVAVPATADDPSGVHAVTLYWRTAVEPPAEPNAWAAVPMTELAAGGWQGTIPGHGVTGTAVEYYVMAADGSPKKNTSTWPPGAPETPESFTVATRPDEDGPTITVTPVADGQSEGVAVPITAKVTDDSGVASVTLHFRLAGTADWATAAMSPAPAADGTWTGEIPAGTVAAPGVDWFIDATDASPNANVSVSPAGAPDGAAPYTFTVGGAVDTMGPRIEHTLPTAPVPAGKALVLAAKVTDPSGVAEVLVHYVPEGAGEWKSASLGVGEDGETWTVEVPGSDVKVGNFAYFLEARDGSPAANVSYDPDKGGDDPHVLSVQDSPVVKPNPSSGGGCGASTASGGLAPTAGAAALAAVLAAMLPALFALGARRRGRAAS